MSPSRVAVVARLWLFEPASGSVIANTIFVPLADGPGATARFCASEPKRAISSAQIAGDDEDEQQRASLRRELLAHDRELAHASAAAAVGLGQVHRQEAVVGDGLPQLVGLAARARLLGEVLVAERRREVAYGRPDQLVLGALGEVHGRPAVPNGERTAPYFAAASRKRVVRCTGSVSSFGITYSPRRRMVSSVPSRLSGPIPNDTWSAPALSHRWHAASAWSGVPADHAAASDRGPHHLLGHLGQEIGPLRYPVGMRERVVVPVHVALQVRGVRRDHVVHRVVDVLARRTPPW